MKASQALEKAKQNKVATVIIVVLLLAAMIYFFRNKIFVQKASHEEGYIKTGSSTPSTSGSSTIGENTMLKRGSRGEAVKELQRLLNQKQKTTIPDANSPLFLLHGAMQDSLLKVDGIFGVKTEHSLQRWTGLNTITLAQARKILSS